MQTFLFIGDEYFCHLLPIHHCKTYTLRQVSKQLCNDLHKTANILFWPILILCDNSSYLYNLYNIYKKYFFMSVCICLYPHAHTCYICMHAYMYIGMKAYMYIYIHACNMHVCIHVQNIHGCIHLFIPTHMHICLHSCVYKCMHA